VQHGPVRAGDVKHSRAAVDLLHATGFKPVSSLKEGLAAMIANG
jgi:nucleoside-diphosphate-sugar epimerase